MFYFIISILTFFLGSYFTQHIAKQVAFSWRKRDDTVQIKIEQAREKKKDIEDIRNLMVTLASERYNFASILIDQCIDHKHNNEDIDLFRSQYRKSVDNWNMGLTKINLEMHRIGLQIVAQEMEGHLHKAFYDSHIILNNYFDTNRSPPATLQEARELVESARGQILNYSNILYKEATEQLSQIQVNDFYKEDTIPNEQLYQTSILKLIKLIFYRRENFFRIY